MATFLGRSTHTLDDKGRLILPKRLLHELAPKDRKFTLTAGPDGNLLLLDEAAWAVVAARTSGDVLGNKAQRSMRRIFLGHAEKVEPDRSNRISIAEGLREFAGLGDSKDVVLVGTGQNFEIWAKRRWESALADALSIYEFSDNDLVGSTASSQP
jgi:transcriptional regulator MraZ